MTSRGVLLAVLLIITALLVQVSVINPIPLPGGRPDVMVLIVVALALVGGPQRGAIVGFGAGLAVDLLPPADHLVGRFAFTYTIIGYLAGLLEDTEQNSVFATILIVAGAAASTVLLYAGVGALVGDARVTPHITIHVLIATVVYDVILAPFVVPLVSAVARRLEQPGLR